MTYSITSRFTVLTLSGHLLIILITCVLLWTGYDLFPTEFETLPMYDWSVPWMRRSLAWNFRHEYENRYVRKWFLQVGLRLQICFYLTKWMC